jgi:hypothetical protein
VACIIECRHQVLLRVHLRAAHGITTKLTGLGELEGGLGAVG